MRISTMQMNNSMQYNMMSTSSSMNTLLMKMSTGKSILKPSDDTLASSQILGLKNANASLESYEKTMGSAVNSLTLAETIITDMSDVLNRVRDLTLGMGGVPEPYEDGEGGGNSSANLQEIEMLMQTLADLANTRSNSGEYIFGGTKGGVPPIGSDDNGTTIGGSDDPREVQISDSQTVDVGVVAGDLFTLDDGSNIFEVMDAYIAGMSDPDLSQEEKDQLMADTLEAIDGTLANMNQALTHIGGTMNTIERAMASNKDVQAYNTMMSDSLEALDYAGAITDFSMLQAQYTASQKAYAMVGSASLFDYL